MQILSKTGSKFGDLGGTYPPKTYPRTLGVALVSVACVFLQAEGGPRAQPSSFMGPAMAELMRDYFWKKKTLEILILVWFSLSAQECHLYVEVTANQWPIVYSEDYNIGFMGLEKLHPFDSGKWGKVFQYLKGINKEECFMIEI